jgi:hypothetical protein
MIYLIDDKKTRQENDFGWSLEKTSKYQDVLLTFSTIEEIRKIPDIDQIVKSSIVLFHESFAVLPHQKDELAEFKRRIMATENKNVHVAVFSGSKFNRFYKNQKAHLPVSIVYRNIDVLIQKYLKGESNLNYLLFGQNYKIEQELVQLREKLLNTIDFSSLSLTGDKILFIRTFERSFRNPYEIGIEKIVSRTNTDEEIELFINDNLNQEKYDKIFIPLCYGDVLSDYNGLTLATHIRCTDNINNLSQILIYGFVDLNYLLNHEYFDILKTKNVKFINFNKNAFEEAAELRLESLTLNELSIELSKLNLHPPQNYYDNHSIANEWGVFQMARNANIKMQEVDGFDSSKINSLYFRWLILKNRLNEPISEEQKEEQKRYSGTLPGLKILGKIELPKSKRK